MGNLDGRRFEDVIVIDPATGERKLALRKARWFRGASPDGSRLLFYDDGAWFTYDTVSGKQTEISKGVATSFIDTEDDHNVNKPPEASLGWSKDGQYVLLSDGWDLWKVPAKGGAAVNLTVNGKKDKIRYRQRFRLDPDEKGIDLDQPIYVSAYGEWTKKSGIGMIEPGKAGVRMLQWGDARYAALTKAKHADTYLFTRETVKESPDLYVAGKLLENPQKVTDINPQQKDFLWTSGVRLIDYTSTRGEKLQAALFLPANYDPSKKYPAVVEIYEKMSQNANVYPQPGYNGFSVSAYTSNGYAVIEPDIVYKVNDPGMSAVACVVPAVKAAVATGVVDADTRRHTRPLLGRLPDRLPGDPDRHLPRRRGGRAAHRHGQHVQPDLSQQRRHQPGDLREQPGTLLRRLLGQPRSLPAQLARVPRQERAHAAHDPAQR